MKTYKNKKTGEIITLSEDWEVVDSATVVQENCHTDTKQKEYITLDSGKRETFRNSEAVRDTEDGKPRYDLISPFALKRIAELYARGAEKYGEFNWTKGGITFKRYLSSLLRHTMQFAQNDTQEDHLSAICFNAMAIIHYQEINRKDLDDRHEWKK